MVHEVGPIAFASYYDLSELDASYIPDADDNLDGLQTESLSRISLASDQKVEFFWIILLKKTGSTRSMLSLKLYIVREISHLTLTQQ